MKPFLLFTAILTLARPVVSAELFLANGAYKTLTVSSTEGLSPIPFEITVCYQNNQMNNALAWVDQTDPQFKGACQINIAKQDGANFSWTKRCEFFLETGSGTRLPNGMQWVATKRLGNTGKGMVIKTEGNQTLLEHSAASQHRCGQISSDSEKLIEQLRQKKG